MIIPETIAVAFSMYSAIPVPQFEWNEKNMRYSLCAFPLIGVVIGFVCWGIAAACSALDLPDILKGALLCAAPVVITGGIHLDGYADTCDALASHADREKKLKILSDPHIGSFAVIRLCCLFLFIFAGAVSLKEFQPLAFIPAFCLSRILSALAVSAFPKAKKEGLAYSFAEAMKRKRNIRILAVMDVLVSAVMCISGLTGIIMVLTAHAVFLYYYIVSRKIFRGITGDLAGWFLVKAEAWMLFAAALCGYIL